MDTWVRLPGFESVGVYINLGWLISIHFLHVRRPELSYDSDNDETSPMIVTLTYVIDILSLVEIPLFDCIFVFCDIFTFLLSIYCSSEMF